MTLFQLLGKITVDPDPALKNIDKVENAADKSSTKMNASFTKVGGLLKGAFLGAAGLAAGAVAGIGIAGVKGAAELETATGKMRAALGLTEEDAKRMGGVVTELYRSGVGGSITEAAEKVTMLRQVMGDLTDEQTQKLTSMAATIQDVYGADYQNTVSAAQTLTEQFGLTGQQAMDFITTGFENGLDRSGDFLDSIGEYATQFSNGGADAGQFFSVLESGLQGGVNGTDKAADAFKEFRLRIQDGSTLTADSLALIGISADDMAEKISSGQMTAAEAFQLVINKLGETEDPMIRMQAGAGLIGTQFEDLGDNAVAALSMTTTSLEDMAGATDAAGKAAYDNLGGKLTSLWRILQTGATDALGPLIPMLSEFVDVLIERAPLMIDAGKQVATYIAQWSPQITELIGRIGPVVTDIFGLMAAAWTNVVRPVWSTIAPYVSGVFGLIAGTIKAFKLILEGDFSGAWSAAVEGVKSFLTGLEEFLDNFFGGLWGLIQRPLVQLKDNIVTKAEEIKDGFVEHFTNLKDDVWKWAVDLWAYIAAPMSSFKGQVVNKALEVYNEFTSSFDDLKERVVTIISGLWDGVKTHLQAFATNVVDEIQGIPGRIADVGQKMVDRIISGITGKKPDLERAAEETANVVPETVKKALDERSPSKVLYQLGAWATQGLAQGVTDPASVTQLNTAAETVGRNFATRFYQVLGIDQPENDWVVAGRSVVQGFLDGMAEKWPEVTAFLQRIRDARPDVPLLTNEWSGQEGPSAEVVGSRPVPTPGVSAAVSNLVNVVIPAVSAAFGRLVQVAIPNVEVGLGNLTNIAIPQVSAAGSAMYHSVLNEAALTADANRIRRDTENAMAITHLAQMQSGALGAQAWIQATWQNTTSWVSSTFQNAVSWVGSTLQNAGNFAWDAMTSIGSGLLNLAVSEVPGLGAAMGAMAGGPVAMLAAFFIDLFSSTWQFQSIIDRATTIMQPLIDTVGDLLTALWPLIQVSLNLMRLGLQPIIWSLQNIVNPVFGFVARTIAHIWNGLARALNHVFGWLGVRIPTINVNAGPPPTNQQRQDTARQNEHRRQQEEQRRRDAESAQERQNREREQARQRREQESERRRREQQERKRRQAAEEAQARQQRDMERRQGNQSGPKAPKAPKAPRSPGYSAPGGGKGYKPPKLGSPGSGYKPPSSPGSPGGGYGGGGTKVSEITGPTRDLFMDLLSPLVVLPDLVGIGNRIYDLMEQNSGVATSIQVGMPALAGGPVITNHIHMNATGRLDYDVDQLTRAVSTRLEKALAVNKRGRGG